MPGSYKSVNFRLRPAKHIERKMFVDSLRRLSSLSPIERYRYVGIGANTFVDSELFHRYLGIVDMISIQDAETDQARFELNKPFGAIRMEYGLSSAILPEISWDPPTIVWLDYDKQLDGAKVADIKLVIGSATPGSVLLVSVCAEPEHSAETVLEELRGRVGTDRVPLGTSEEDLQGWGFGRVCRQVIWDAIAETLSDRNAVLAAERQLEFFQFANFEYPDGVRMVTIGGAVATTEQASILLSTGLDEPDWYRPGDRAYRIRTPPLTLREMHHLDAQFPCDIDSADLAGIPRSDAVAYAEVYRFFPNYVDADY